jgi:hypothetical protein
MVIQDRSIGQIDWWSVGISAAAGAVAPGWIGISRAAMSSTYLAEKFAGLTLRDLGFIQGAAFSVSSLMKKGMAEKQANDSAYAAQCK